MLFGARGLPPFSGVDAKELLKGIQGEGFRGVVEVQVVFGQTVMGCIGLSVTAVLSTCLRLFGGTVPSTSLRLSGGGGGRGGGGGGTFL